MFATFTAQMGKHSPYYTTMDKLCPVCKIIRPVTAFGKRKNDRPRGWCIECERLKGQERYRQFCVEIKARTSAWDKTNRDLKLAYIRKYQLKSKYGITSEEFLRLEERQGGICAICFEPPKSRRLSVDHDHITGRVRGLLCTRCNLAVSAIDDFSHWYSQVRRYLQIRPAVGLPRGRF